MDYQKYAEKLVKKALGLGVDEAEVLIQESREFSLEVRNGEVETVKQATIKGIGLTVYKDKKLGSSYTSDFSEQSLAEFVKKTVELSAVGDSKPENGLPDHERGEQKDLDLWDPSIREIPSDKKIDMAKEAERIALSYDKRIKNSGGGSFADSETEIILVNSKGLSRRFKITSVGFGVSVIAGEGNEMQSGSWGTSKRHFKDLMGVEEVAKRAGKRAVEKLGPKPIKTQKVPIVFDRYAAPSFWMGILFALNGDSVFKKTTFLTDLLEKPLASDKITIIDDPTLRRHIASVPYDGEGKVTRKNTLIEKGILKMFIYDTITARKAGAKVNTITQRSGYKGLPSASFLNIVVQNGNMELKKIIQGIDEGFYATGLRGTGTDIPTGNYSCGASGFWIKNGEIAFPVDGITLGGSVLDLLKNIEVLANDLDIRGSLNSPSIKIAEIAVGGKT